MRVEILGSAAGGAFPQWNCSCRNCRALRSGLFAGKARSQLQVAVSADGKTWFLLNASPDLRVQIESNPFLHPSEGIRHSPIAGVVITSADLDQTLGLLLLRELQPLQIYSTASIRRVLRDDNSMFGMLERVPKRVQWQNIVPDVAFGLASTTGEPSGIECLPVLLGTRYPSYVGAEREAALEPLEPKEALLGLILQAAGGQRLGYFPAVPALDDALVGVLRTVDVLLFDGTFWSDNELIEVQGSGQTARQMGHVPVSSEQGSLRRLAELTHPRKIFVHINNTNPMLDESGAEYRQVRDAGWEVAEDGWRLDL
jgi:pyrroloquinoline quinone biosynthesis protein B